MKNPVIIIYAFLFSLLLSGCEKTTNDDIQFLATGQAPQDLQVTVSVNPAGVATITPSATGVSSFHVYFDANDTSYAVVLPGRNIVHTYLEGNYTVKVVALNVTGQESVLTKAISVTTSTLLVDFETPATTYVGNAFGGAAFAQIANPHASGINTSTNVGQITKGSPGSLSEIWAGITINTSSRFSFASLGIMKMKVYSNHAGAIFKFKLEAPSSGGTVETDVLTTVANGWEELTFQMDPSVIGRSFGGFSIFYEFGLQGDGSANFVGLFDDIKVYP